MKNRCLITHLRMRCVVGLFLIAAFPATMFAPIIYRSPDLTTGLNSDYTLLQVDLSYPANRGWTNTVQQSPDLLQWTIIDAVTPQADGTVVSHYFLPLSTTRMFFRLGIPQPQINFVQPFTVSSTGGFFFIIGQAFDPSFTVWIDGNLVSSTFIDGSTIQVNVGALSVGFHTITLRDNANNVITTLANGLAVTPTGRSDQESPPSSPAVNCSPIDFNGPPGLPDYRGGNSEGVREIMRNLRTDYVLPPVAEVNALMFDTPGSFASPGTIAVVGAEMAVTNP